MPKLRVDGEHGSSGRIAAAVSRLRRFPDNRLVGRRDQMVVYDCDDPVQFDELSRAVTELDLDTRNSLQAFAPDTLIECSNRGFRPFTTAETDQFTRFHPQLASGAGGPTD